MNWDIDAPTSVSEMNLERIRIDAEVEKERIKRQAEIKVARANARLSGSDRGVAACIIAVIICAGVVVGIVNYGSIQSDRARAETIKACVDAGSQWKQNMNAGWECVR